MTKYTRQEIEKNVIQCNSCKDIIESTYAHEFKWCSCGGCAVDGGRSYLKRSFKSPDGYTDLSITKEVEYESDF